MPVAVLVDEANYQFRSTVSNLSLSGCRGLYFTSPSRSAHAFVQFIRHLDYDGAAPLHTLDLQGNAVCVISFVLLTHNPDTNTNIS